jgi:hypothetical protein
MPLKIVKVVIYGLSETIDLSTNAPSYQPEYSGIETQRLKMILTSLRSTIIGNPISL